MPPSDVAYKYRNAVEQAAKAMLEAPEKIAPGLRPATMLLQIGAAPAFDNSIVWHAQVQDETLVRVHRVTWDRQAMEDAIRPLVVFLPEQIPAPRMHIAGCLLAAEKWNKLWEASRKLRLPSVLSDKACIGPERDSYVGLDGCSYYLKTGDYWGGLRLNWWSDGPAGWEQLVEWVKRVCIELDAALDDPLNPHKFRSSYPGE